jgi:hypothetical protein
LSYQHLQFWGAPLPLSENLNHGNLIVHLSWKQQPDDDRINDIIAIQGLNFKTRKRSRSKLNKYVSLYESASAMSIECRVNSQRVKEERYSINVCVVNKSDPYVYTLYRSDNLDESASMTAMGDWLCVHHTPQQRGKSTAVGISVYTQCHSVDRVIFEVFLLKQPILHEL